MDAEKVSRISNRGFASMSAERRQELARKGGKTAQTLGKAHRFTSEEARIAAEKSRQSRALKVAENVIAPPVIEHPPVASLG